MRILNGWKEIAEFLHRTPRSARRWERLGLPVRRLSDSSRSPVIAFSNDIENWARLRGQVYGSNSISENILIFRQTRLETQRLIAELRAARAQHQKLVATTCDQARQDFGRNRSLEVRVGRANARCATNTFSTTQNLSSVPAAQISPPVKRSSEGILGSVI